MNDAKRERIAALAIIEHQARLKYDMHAMSNAYQLPEEARERAWVEYQIARAEWIEAAAHLEVAMRQP